MRRNADDGRVDHLIALNLMNVDDLLPGEGDDFVIEIHSLNDSFDSENASVETGDEKEDFEERENGRLFRSMSSDTELLDIPEEHP